MSATACDIYCDKHPVCRLLNDQPLHYFDCDRFQTYDYGLKQGKCDCTATADVNEALDQLAEVKQRASEVMDALENYGPSIVPHLMDTDDNSGEFLRRALCHPAESAGGTRERATE